MIINATLRALLLNVSDLINEHDAATGYAIRDAVSGRETADRSGVEIDVVAVRALLSKGLEGAGAFVLEHVRAALEEVVALGYDIPEHRLDVWCAREDAIRDGDAARQAFYEGALEAR